MSIENNLQNEESIFPDSPWHMTIGGRNRSHTLNSVELFNWKTGKQCYIKPLPQVYSSNNRHFMGLGSGSGLWLQLGLSFNFFLEQGFIRWLDFKLTQKNLFDVQQ
jgi:hypothetical protein